MAEEVKGVTFEYGNSNMKIVLHVPDKLQDDIDKGDICSRRCIVWYPMCFLIAPLSLFVKASCCTQWNICVCLWDRALVYKLVEFNFKQRLSHFPPCLCLPLKNMIYVNGAKRVLSGGII